MLVNTLQFIKERYVESGRTTAQAQVESPGALDPWASQH